MSVSVDLAIAVCNDWQVLDIIEYLAYCFDDDGYDITFNCVTIHGVCSAAELAH